LISETINSDQFSEAKSLILAIHGVLTGRENFVYSTIGRKQMNPSTQDQIKGTVHEVKGKIKETAGKVTNNPNLEAEGNVEKNTGKIENKVGQIEKVFEK
jgi:uncharacterized protein YjbJ (UPF0337 family)